jgi:hypothetical protein
MMGIRDLIKDGEEIMPSFFESIRRLISGQPVFEDEDQPRVPPGEKKSEEAQQRDANEPAITKSNDSTFPVVHVKRAETKLSGNTAQVYGWIENTWSEEIMLDKIRMFGATRELDSFLRPGESREFLVYSGPKIQREYPEALLDYKTKNEGDYFEAVHDVTFSYQPDKTYNVSEVRLRKPIRDIYG